MPVWLVQAEEWVTMLANMIPVVIKALRTIMTSNPGHSPQTAFTEWVNHNTSGQPNSPALS